MKLLPLPDTPAGGHNPRAQAALDLTLIHNALFRALNNIYIQSPHIPLFEYTHFSSHALATYLGLSTNNSSSLFDSRNNARSFETPLTAWGNWVKSISSRKNNFSAEICRGMMDDFIVGLHVYWEGVLQDMLKAGEQDVDKVMKEYRNGVFGSMSKTEVLPMFVPNHDLRVGGKWK
jgi:hypothetical protein